MTTRGRSPTGQLHHLLEDRPAVHLGHHQVEDHQLRVVLLELLEGFHAVAGREGPVPLVLQGEPKDPRDLWLVVDDQHASASVHVCVHLTYPYGLRRPALDTSIGSFRLGRSASTVRPMLPARGTNT